MGSISPWQLDTIAVFLETSREFLEIESTIQLHWPRPGAVSAGHRYTLNPGAQHYRPRTALATETTRHRAA